MGGVINPDIHGPFDGSSDALWFPIHYGEIFQFDDLSCSLRMVEDGEGGHEMLLVPFTKIPASVTYVLHGTPWLVTFKSLYNSPLFTDAVLVLGSYQ